MSKDFSISDDNNHSFIINMVIEKGFKVDRTAMLKCICLIHEGLDDNTQSTFSHFVIKYMNLFKSKEYKLYKSNIINLLNNGKYNAVRKLCTIMNNCEEPGSLDEMVLKWS